ncbi:hypothetical protein CDD83_4566 [Cordyceps sp. RAO-2017]|nr:hypothetical protein CDD83_4566 [Cordyceps sp. RAO-2017]
MARPQLPQDALLQLALHGMHDRVLGCIVGSALGDAIGLYTEFLSASAAAQAYPSRAFTLLPKSQATAFRRDAHRNPHQPGEWTDDTDHALLILLSFLHSGGRDMSAQDVASRLKIWVQQGLRALDTLPLGLGNTVGSIVRKAPYLEDPEGTARQHWVDHNYNAAPNGSLMRTHPLGLMCLHKTADETFQTGADFSVITHVDPRCVVSCVIGTALVRGLLRHEVYTEEHVDQVINSAVAWYSHYQNRRLARDAGRAGEPDLDIDELRRHVKVNELSDLQLDDAMKMGYVYKTLGSGVHLLRLALRKVASSGNSLSSQIDLFEPLVVDLIMQGGDADTNACFAGALLGAYLGFRALPPHWRDGLRHGSWLLAKAEALSKVLGVAHGQYDASQDADTAPDGGRGFLSEREVEEKVMLLQARMAQDEQRFREQEDDRANRGKRWFGRRWG